MIKISESQTSIFKPNYVKESKLQLVRVRLNHIFFEPIVHAPNQGQFQTNPRQLFHNLAEPDNTKML